MPQPSDNLNKAVEEIAQKLVSHKNRCIECEEKLLEIINNEKIEAEYQARLNLLLKLKQVPPIDWLDAQSSIDQWLATLKKGSE